MITIDAALTDANLLGAGLGDPSPWATWLVALKAAFGMGLNRAERRAFAKIAGERKPPSHRVRELWCVIGRRAGKSRIAAGLAVYFATFIPHRLAPGETGMVLVIASSKRQAGHVLGYALGFLRAAPMLAEQIETVTDEEIRLRGGIVIAVHTASFRSVRGPTLLAAVFDEVSFWRDETSSSPDIEVYRAVLPALATTGGMLVGISTPYRKLGLLHQKHRDHFGQDNPDVLVVAGDSRTFNPTLNASVIESARAEDPEAAMAEWDGQFRSDIAAFLDDATIESAIDYGRPLELPPRHGIRYGCFVDPSGGRGDAMTVCIGHIERERFVADVIRGRHPPFNPQEVVKEFAALANAYGCREVTGDNYSAAWVETAFRDFGVRYVRAEMPKSALALEALAEFMRGSVSIPDHARLIRELRLLERRTSRIGRDIIDHGRSGHDDHANALFGAMRLATMPKAGIRVATLREGYATPGKPPEAQLYLLGRREQLARSWSRQPGISAVDGSRERADPPHTPFRLHVN